MRADVIHGDCLDVMRGMPDASVDAVVTDPPYGLAFMGKEWDHGVPASPFWAEALRVAKPGAALLAFGGSRTFHGLACAIEDAGWRIYDCLSWMYGQGFPKHRTHLKPAWEPIVFASKKGARFVNVEGCRLATDVELRRNARGGANGLAGTSTYRIRERRVDDKPQVPGRWPANVVLDEEAAQVLDEATAIVVHSAGFAQGPQEKWSGPRQNQVYGGGIGCGPNGARFGDSGGASRFFYVAKASRADREDGLEKSGPRRKRNELCPGDVYGNNRRVRNVHPTVKPTDLMRWLCRLVTPPGGLVLDPFCGSGSTGVAANAEGFDFIGIERDAEYVEIARRRIANVAPLFAQGGAA